jgi:chloramphenicol 3-O-phosphotransferase
MPSNLPARRSILGALSTDRATGKELSTVQAGAFVERAQDEARRNLTLARMSDFGLATHHALDEADEIVRDVVRRIQANEFGAQAFTELGEEGFRALKHELRRLTEGGL